LFGRHRPNQKPPKTKNARTLRSGRFRDETEPGGYPFSRGFSPTPAEQAIACATSNPVGLAANIRDNRPCGHCFFPEPSPWNLRSAECSGSRLRHSVRHVIGFARDFLG
jgi:hypothetical protein